MATRSTISMNIEGQCENAIYCHNDGYPSHMAPLLINKYNTIEKVSELLELGDISVLGSRVKPNPGEMHSFDNPTPHVTIAYHRDRGEPLMFSGKGMDEEYNYVFDGKEWYLKEDNSYIPLSGIKYNL